MIIRRKVSVTVGNEKDAVAKIGPRESVERHVENVRFIILSYSFKS